VWTGTTVNHCARHRSIGPAEVSRVLEQRGYHQFDGGRALSPSTLTSLLPYSDELQGGCLGRHVAAQAPVASRRLLRCFKASRSPGRRRVMDIWKRSCIRASSAFRLRVKQQYSSWRPLGSLK